MRSTGAAPVVIELGATRERDGTTQIACRRGSDLFWVNDRVQPSLGLAPILWRSALVYPFESWDVEKVTLSNGEASASLDRTSGMWHLADGSEADNSGMLDRLSKLSQLEAAAYDLVDPGTAEIGSVELTLSTGPDDTEQLITYTFKAPMSEGGKMLVKVSERETLMSAEAADVEAVIADLDTIRAPEPEEPEDEG